MEGRDLAERLFSVLSISRVALRSVECKATNMLSLTSSMEVGVGTAVAVALRLCNVDPTEEIAESKKGPLRMEVALREASRRAIIAS